MKKRVTEQEKKDNVRKSWDKRLRSNDPAKDCEPRYRRSRRESRAYPMYRSLRARKAKDDEDRAVRPWSLVPLIQY